MKYITPHSPQLQFEEVNVYLFMTPTVSQPLDSESTLPVLIIKLENLQKDYT